MLKSVNVNGKSNPGFSSGDAIIAVQEVAAQHLQNLPEFSGLTREEIIAGKNGCFIEFDICLLLIKRSVRKLFSSAINSSFITGWCRWSYWFRLSLRIGKQYLLPGRFDYAYRVARQECHFDRRICHTKATQRNGFDKSGNRRAHSRPILRPFGLHIWFITIGLASR
jgi:hypothetical protein